MSNYYYEPVFIVKYYKFYIESHTFPKNPFMRWIGGNVVQLTFMTNDYCGPIYIIKY